MIKNPDAIPRAVGRPDGGNGGAGRSDSGPWPSPMPLSSFIASIRALHAAVSLVSGSGAASMAAKNSASVLERDMDFWVRANQATGQPMKTKKAPETE